MKKSIRILSFLIALLVCLGLASCGSSASNTSKDEASTEQAVPGEAYDTGKSGSAPSLTQPDVPKDNAEAGADRKLIKNYSAEIQTLEFENTISTLEEMVANAGGYIESSSQSGRGAVDYGRVYPRDASYTVRIPAGTAGNFVESLSQIGSVTNSSQHSDDITDYYYDTEAHLTILRAQETRLLELLAKAENVSDMITIESSLADVRYQIESLDGTMKRLDSQIEYSSVAIHINEVFTEDELQREPLSLGERISSRFKSSIKEIKNACTDFIVFVVGDSVIIVFWAAVIAVLGIVTKKIYKKLYKKPKE
ncbi:MAG: DUF4349 domain-containing protein [Clostridiaceae bacterium]|nr:DUF4349 domain-containing protein [Clostridiaceae bacterium]